MNWVSILFCLLLAIVFLPGAYKATTETGDWTNTNAVSIYTILILVLWEFSKW